MSLLGSNNGENIRVTVRESVEDRVGKLCVSIFTGTEQTEASNGRHLLIADLARRLKD